MVSLFRESSERLLFSLNPSVVRLRARTFLCTVIIRFSLTAVEGMMKVMNSSHSQGVFVTSGYRIKVKGGWCLRSDALG